MQNVTAKVIPLDRIGADAVGGKAAQLAQLARLGLRVPEGFVIVGAAQGNLPAELDEYSDRLGGAVAVRSSALGEDGAEASFAGQFETVLAVEGAPAIREAVERCLTSAASARAQAYRDEMRAQTNGSMAVVVQRMVDASTAGVIFTVDPVTGQRDRVVINAVRGLGEALVGGYRTPDHFVVSREGSVLERELHGERGSVEESRLGELLEGALKAEAGLGYPLDLEWAIGRDNRVYWLQARPITTLDLPGPDELDDAIDPAWQLTWHNIAEWMPGAMTPLSWSVVGPSYIFGMNELFVRAGIARELVESVPLLLVVHGHVFINMSNFYLLGSQMFGMDKDSSDLTLTGHVLPEATLPPSAPALQRLSHTLRYFSLVPAGRKRLDAFIARYSSFRVEPSEDLAEHYRRLQSALDLVNESAAVHVHTSMMAIALLGLFQRIFSKGGPPSAKSQAAVAALLAGAKAHAAGAAASSIGVADALNDLGALIAAEPAVAEHFVRMPGEEALQWLRSPSSGCVGKAFESFLTLHGHRCIRELELRERDWQEDPLPMVHSLQLVVAAPRATQTGWAREANEALAELSWGARRLVQWLLPTAQASVVVRERSKSFRVWFARQVKRGYVAFAERLVAEGRLPDADLVFFFTHEELGRLAQGPDRALVRRGEHRRRLHPRKMAVEFPYVCQGKPIPLTAAQGQAEGNGDSMQGTPLSRGVAVGPARVARNLAEAAAMQPGEILVTPFTDVGWTPYFSRAAGLATEVGSVLSHGAVVAREYGLPAVAGFPGLTRRVKTGDMLRVDGNSGQLRRMTSGPGQ
ncbi:MAG TPA: PEP/pyruvate-binding domain-containing protein [Burkholderiales bacterium]|nr:PEP/pyruvate-binding domain-containing protein [Burkholderiales bacterium]